MVWTLQGARRVRVAAFHWGCADQSVCPTAIRHDDSLIGRNASSRTSYLNIPKLQAYRALILLLKITKYIVYLINLAGHRCEGRSKGRALKYWTVLPLI